MKILDTLKNDYFRLFVKREGKVVLGKNYSSLWLLTAVLTATFLAIAFSNASLDYLSYKMDDPFINWVDIKNEFGEGDFIGLESALEYDENKEKYHYYNSQADYLTSMWFFGKDENNQQYMQGRFFSDITTPLVNEILSKDNVIRNWGINDLSSLDPNTIGLIITEAAMNKLGYDAPPAFMDIFGNSEGAEKYGFDLVIGSYARVPIPVLAVVEKLPGNVDFISSTYLYLQWSNNRTFPFSLAKDSYAENLSYFVPKGVKLSDFHNDFFEIATQFTDLEIEMDEYCFYKPEIIPFVEGDFIVFKSYDYVDYDIWKSINTSLLKKYSDHGVYRVYDYEFSPNSFTSKPFVSVHFEKLDEIRNFEKWILQDFNVKIEMSQINAKENFNAVSTMGNILSWVIIVFAIVCIILFIVNLLQSYFQKVKRNLGTFKAFGISNRDLISVYVLIMGAIIVVSIVMSLSVTWMIQGFLHVCGILKDGVFDYLSLWSVKTVCSVVIIVLASVYTVFAVMRSLLKATPGDLIYDRQ